MAKATFACTCPHCLSKMVAFTVHHAYSPRGDLRKLTVFAACNKCSGPVAAVFENATGVYNDLIDKAYDLFNTPELNILAFYPKTEPAKAPDGVPDMIARRFLEAFDNLKSKKFSPACMMFRLVLELALKDVDKNAKDSRLVDRIDRLAAQHKITPAMKEWAHELRLDGNDAVHGLVDATEDLAEQMHDLCKFLLIYLYTLPKQVEEARSRRGNG